MIVTANIHGWKKKVEAPEWAIRCGYMWVSLPAPLSYSINPEDLIKDTVSTKVLLLYDGVNEFRYVP